MPCTARAEIGFGPIGRNARSVLVRTRGYRDILRTIELVYQFRDARLQDRLASQASAAKEELADLG